MRSGTESHQVALVTGANGFLGANLCKAFTNMGWEVHALVRSTSNVAPLAGVLLRVHVLRSTATQEIIDIVGAAKPNAVIHLAATQLAQHTPGDLDALLESNVRLGTQILEAMCIHGVGIFVNTGTYWQHYEGRKYDPVSLYAACKKAFQDLLVYYRNVRGIRATTLVLTDTYGDQDPRGKILGRLVEAARTGERLDLTLGEQRIDLVHVSDVVEAFLQAVTLLRADQLGGEAYAVSTGRLVTLRQLAKMIEDASGKRIRAVWGARPYPARQIMETIVIEPRLPGWEPSVSLENGIQRMIAATAIK